MFSDDGTLRSPHVDNGHPSPSRTEEGALPNKEKPPSRERPFTGRRGLMNERGVPLVQTPMGQKKVSIILVRCPYFRG